MSEYAFFMRVALPSERPDIVRQAEAFEERFRSLKERVNRAGAAGPDIRRAVLEAVVEFIEFKRLVLRMMIQCQIRPTLLPLLIDHLAREALHFLTRLEAALGNESEEGRSMLVVLRREVFLMRLMKEHVEFIVHMLDPSERALVAQGRIFRRTFVRLLQTAVDLESMAEAEAESFNGATRFVDEAAARTADLRDYKAAAYELLLMCRALSVVPSPLLPDRVHREAEGATVEAWLCEPRRPSY